ncbi:MAG: hypothetical protein RL417_379, partial [Pseudomonadota bacterium]
MGHASIRFPSTLHRLILVLSLLGAIGNGGVGTVAAQEAATVYSAQGTVELQAPGAAGWQAVAVGQKISDRDTVRTGAASRAALVLSDGLMVRLNQNSFFQVKLDGSGVPSDLELKAGDGHFFSRKEREFPRIKTELVSASIRGTELTVTARDDRSEVTVLAGLVRAENTFGGVDLAGGEKATVLPGSAPRKAILVDPIEAVQWALYYPVILDIAELPEFRSGLSSEEERGAACLRAGDGACALGVFKGDSPRDRLGRAVGLYQLGDPDGALAALGSEAPSPSFDIIRAALALGRGQVGEAATLHKKVEARLGGLTPEESAGLRSALLAQRAVVAVSRNDIAGARELSSEAMRISNSTPSAAIAYSFVEQGAGQVDAAYEAIAAALAHYPENPALVLRRAELRLSRGESEEALQDAALITERMPTNSYGLTVRGFAELARLDIEGAKISFTKAIEMGAGDGLPFLGRGLTEIRRGDLEGGRRSIQQAAHLEPARALYRSYLGKALFEDEQEDLSGEEYERAIALDPNDPTPYLYRTFLHLSKNEPIKALDDIEASIKLNDNRAVYRSRLLLDQDASVR